MPDINIRKPPWTSDLEQMNYVIILSESFWNWFLPSPTLLWRSSLLTGPTKAVQDSWRQTKNFAWPSEQAGTPEEGWGR